MNLIQRITTDFAQSQTLILDDGTTIALTIAYKPLLLGWFIVSLTYGNFEVRGMRICTLPNLLYQFKNQIPFGLACFTKDDREPTQREDFASGNSKLYILTAAEVAQYVEFLSSA